LIAFLDTSALLKLYLLEAGSEEAREQVEAAAEIVTAMVAYAEARSALAALRRARRLQRNSHLAVKQALEADWPQFRKVAVSEAVCREAGELAERYGLRGYDSVQLACYAQLVRSAGDHAVAFCCFDARLQLAARRWQTAERRRRT